MASDPLVFNRTAQEILLYIHYASPIVLVASFLVAFTVHSIATAQGDPISASTDKTGPGGKPLPQSKSSKAEAQHKIRVLDFSPRRKLLFDGLSFAVILTFAANAIVVISHALLDRKDNWWCGQHVAVCSPGLLLIGLQLLIRTMLDLCGGFFLRLFAAPDISD